MGEACAFHATGPREWSEDAVSMAAPELRGIQVDAIQGMDSIFLADRTQSAQCLAFT